MQIGYFICVTGLSMTAPAARLLLRVGRSVLRNLRRSFFKRSTGETGEPGPACGLWNFTWEAPRKGAGHSLSRTKTLKHAVMKHEQRQEHSFAIQEAYAAIVQGKETDDFNQGIGQQQEWWKPYDGRRTLCSRKSSAGSAKGREFGGRLQGLASTLVRRELRSKIPIPIPVADLLSTTRYHERLMRWTGPDLILPDMMMAFPYWQCVFAWDTACCREKTWTHAQGRWSGLACELQMRLDHEGQLKHRNSS
ncbi:uncharacterized protein MYCFIDRAFT_179206 [Pseudocercospora fijiensis CIRAD86]|uniref:Uncharacterized protein n=1 Tax=Pseudocercospora fijiensis (strain CIRAD86) TaxID=383855 RepID=M2ZZX5_PSEFD|nr:uncharacterized protein MYCFIDRAFT_179206 [Pseudocercospora fijiensis CIRAD86]EME77706.1 hypothetical protein MYCFIDRAFT_179206 [Pseudocercospora fijiensis CIRAD86]